MRPFGVVALLALVSVAWAQTATEFDAEVRIYDDPQITGALIANMRYSASQNTIRTTYRISGGSGPIEVLNYTEGIRYLYCTGTCEAETRTRGFPIYSQEATDTTSTVSFLVWPGSGTVWPGTNVQQVNVLTKANPAASGEVKHIYLYQGRIVHAEFTDGRKIDFAAHTAGTAPGKPSSWACPEQTCSTQLDIVFVVDESGSISISEYTKMKQFITAVLDAYSWGPLATQFGMVMFSTDTHRLHWITPDELKFKERFNQYSPLGGLTCISCGIQRGTQLFNEYAARVTAARVMIVLTDGVATGQCDGCTLDGTADIAKSPPNNIIIFAVGVDGASQANLDTIKSNIPGIQTSFKVDEFDQLPTIVKSLITATCLPIPANPCGSTCGGFCSCGKTCLCPDDCSDGNLCTIDGGCASALPNRCTWSLKVVDDQNYCTADSCNTQTGIVTNAYTDECASFSSICGTGVCNPLESDPIKRCSTVANQTGPCNDGKRCTLDNCNRNGECSNPGIPGCVECDLSLILNPGCNHWECQQNGGGAYVNASGNEACWNVEVVTNNVLQKWTPCSPGICDVTCATKPEDCCTFPPLDCNDGDLCTIDSCDATQTTGSNSYSQVGTCLHVPDLCDDDNECTADSCDPTTGCKHVLATDVCPKRDICSLPTCVNECVKQNPSNFSEICQWQIACSEGLVDCMSVPAIADKVNQNGGCFLALCIASAGGCTLEQTPGTNLDDCGNCIPPGQDAADEPCIVGLTADEAAGIAAGVVAAIIIGVIAFLLLAGVGGAGAYKALQAYKGNMGGAQSNPLFKEKAMEGESPLFEEADA